MYFMSEKEIEVLEVTSGTMRLTVRLSGGGVWPSCKITPDDTFNLILTTQEHLNNTFIFRVIKMYKSNFFFSYMNRFSYSVLNVDIGVLIVLSTTKRLSITKNIPNRELFLSSNDAKHQLLLILIFHACIKSKSRSAIENLCFYIYKIFI